MNFRQILLTGSLLALTGTSQAFQLLSLSPKGEVARISQVVAKFDDSAVKFGDPKAAAPLSLQCSDPQASRGTGRWLSDREWVYDFEAELPPGVSCNVQLLSSLKSTSGALLSGASSYKFNSGGPFVQTIWPDVDQRIDEEQAFILQLSGQATLASVQANLWCAVEGLGERVAVRLVDGKDRAAMLKSQNLDPGAVKSPLSFVTLACNRRLPPGAKVQLVYGKGVATPGTSAAKGVANSLEQRFDFQVREPFMANFACERENAQAACLPIRPMRLHFNAPVERKLLEGIRLTSGKDSIKPTLEQAEGDADNVFDHLSFTGLLTEQTAFTLTLPPGFKDAAGRSLKNADTFPLKVSTGAMPPLAKFAAAPFGIVERFAEPDGVAMLPITVRNVEALLNVKGLTPAGSTPASKVSELQATAGRRHHGLVQKSAAV